MTDEKRLLRAIHSDKRGEPEATFEYLYTKYKPLVRFVVARYVRNRSDIDDISQDLRGSFHHPAVIGQETVDLVLHIADLGVHGGRQALELGGADLLLV